MRSARQLCESGVDSVGGGDGGEGWCPHPRCTSLSATRADELTAIEDGVALVTRENEGPASSFRRARRQHARRASASPTRTASPTGPSRPSRCGLRATTPASTRRRRARKQFPRIHVAFEQDEHGNTTRSSCPARGMHAAAPSVLVDAAHVRLTFEDGRRGILRMGRRPHVAVLSFAATSSRESPMVFSARPSACARSTTAVATFSATVRMRAGCGTTLSTSMSAASRVFATAWACILGLLRAKMIARPPPVFGCLLKSIRMSPPPVCA